MSEVIKEDVDLASWLGKRLTPSYFVRIAAPISGALKAFHATAGAGRLLHPSQISISRLHDDVYVKINEFSPEKEVEGRSFNRLNYIAPELARGGGLNSDPRSDLYLLGALFYHLLAGHPPFTSDDPLELARQHLASDPKPLRIIDPGIPAVISSIVSKLLSKLPDDRYQTASALEDDILRCWDLWLNNGAIKEFRLGDSEAGENFSKSMKLYGRDRQLDLLREGFERVRATGRSEIVLVAGESGIGKTRLIEAFETRLAADGHLFAAGKVDQFNAGTHYGCLAAALATLTQTFLAADDVKVEGWAEAVRDAVGGNGDLLVDLIPALETVIGPRQQPGGSSFLVSPARFQIFFERFLQACALPNRPLTLFLDDLQWLDSATIELLMRLIRGSFAENIYLILAFRETEAIARHDLLAALNSIRKSQVPIAEIMLSALQAPCIAQMFRDSFLFNNSDSIALADIVYSKTDGNPFFIKQFVISLLHGGILYYDSIQRKWSWNRRYVEYHSQTENVLSLIIRRISLSDINSRNFLTYMAFIGTEIDRVCIDIIGDEFGIDVRAALKELADLGYVKPLLKGNFAFVHDRIQEAAYGLIDARQRPNVHLKIGRALLAKLSPDELSEHVARVADHFNAASELVADGDEKELLAELNLLAGTKARSVAAISKSKEYCSRGLDYLGEAHWITRYSLIFDLSINLAHAEFLEGDLDKAESSLQTVILRASSRQDRAVASKALVELLMVKSDYHGAIRTALSCLREFNIHISENPTQSELGQLMRVAKERLQDVGLEKLIEIPRSDNREAEAAIGVLAVMFAPAFYTNPLLGHIHVIHMVLLTLDHGIMPASPHGLVWYGNTLGELDGDYERAYQLARIALDLVDLHDFAALRGQALFSLEIVSAVTRPIAEAIETIKESISVSVQSGDLITACYARNHIVTDMLIRGDRLVDVEIEIDSGISFSRKALYEDNVVLMQAQAQFVRALRGDTISVSSFDAANFDTEAFEEALSKNGMTTMVFWYWVLRMKSCYLGGDLSGAHAAMLRARPLRATSPGHVQLLDFLLFSALIVAQLAFAGDEDPVSVLADIRRQFKRLAECNPATFADKEQLVAAELAMVNGDELEAIRRFDQAIELAREQQTHQYIGIASEEAARFHLKGGQSAIAKAYLNTARDAYGAWGAQGKLALLEQEFPELRSTKAAGWHQAPIPTALDIVAVARASQAISSELALPKVIERLMATAIQAAGADFGLLVLGVSGEWLVQGRAEATDAELQVTRCNDPLISPKYPAALVRNVIRNQRLIALDDVLRSTIFSQDEYIRSRRPKSLLCLPIVRNGDTRGVLYVENNVSPNVMPADRVEVLKHIATQGAISLEVARLYEGLEAQITERTKVERALRESERRLHDVIESIPAIAWSSDAFGNVNFVNGRWVEYTGLSREDSMGSGWDAALHPDDLPRHLQSWLKSRSFGAPYEQELRLRDTNGNYRQVQIKAVAVRDEADAIIGWYGMITDVEESRRAQEQLGRLQAELAHASRVAVLGELTASFAHELSQPILAIQTNAETSLRWMRREDPNLEEVGRLTERTIRNARRAGDVLKSIRGMAVHSKPDLVSVDVGEIAAEAILTLRYELKERNVDIAYTNQARYFVLGDRTQLLQVLVNLMMNAVQATSRVKRENHRIAVSLNLNDRYVSIDVEDTGPGLAPGLEGKIFDSFFTTKEGGLGIGLSICKTIVEAHGGYLKASNDTPLGGARFQINIPVPCDDSEALRA